MVMNTASRAASRALSAAAKPKPNPHYPTLLEPLTLRNENVTLRNRAIMGSMHTGLEEGDGITHDLTKMAAFFRERARGGVGLCVTGGIAPNTHGRVAPYAAESTLQSCAVKIVSCI